MPDSHRIISRDLDDDSRIIAVVRNTDTPDQKTDDEILDAMQKWTHERHLHAVDDPE